MSAQIRAQHISEALALLHEAGATDGLSEAEGIAMATAALRERMQEEDRWRQMLRDAEQQPA